MCRKFCLVMILLFSSSSTIFVKAFEDLLDNLIRFDDKNQGKDSDKEVKVISTFKKDRL